MRPRIFERVNSLPVPEALAVLKRYADDIHRHPLSYAPALRKSKHYDDFKRMFPTATTNIELLKMLSDHVKRLP